MKSLWITLILLATCSASVNALPFTQTPEQSYEKSEEKRKAGGCRTYLCQAAHWIELELHSPRVVLPIRHH